MRMLLRPRLGFKNGSIFQNTISVESSGQQGQAQKIQTQLCSIYMEFPEFYFETVMLACGLYQAMTEIIKHWKDSPADQTNLITRQDQRKKEA